MALALDPFRRAPISAMPRRRPRKWLVNRLLVGRLG